MPYLKDVTHASATDQPFDAILAPQNATDQIRPRSGERERCTIDSAEAHIRWVGGAAFGTAWTLAGWEIHAMTRGISTERSGIAGGSGAGVRLALEA
jgi:hypothetical protein